MPDEVLDSSSPPATSESAEPTPAADSDDPIADDTELQQCLLKLYEKVSGEDRYARLIEVKDVKQARMYWRGLQYLWWSDQDQRYNLAGQGQQVGYWDLDIDDMPKFQFVTNIYQSKGLGAIAAITGAPPKHRFFPADAEDPDDLEAAEKFDKLAQLIERWNPTKRLLQEEAYLFWTDGVIGLHTEYVENGERYGFESSEDHEEGEITTPDEVRCSCGFSAPADHFVPPTPCPDCGLELTEDNVVPGETATAPVSAGTNQVPKGRQVISVVGALNLKRPQWAQKQEEFHYLGFEREVHYSVLRAAFKDKRDEIKPGAGFGTEDSFERNARLSVAEGTKKLTQSSGALAVLVTHAKVWFRSSAFDAVDDKVKREELQKLFPRGCRVEFAGPTYLTSRAESMDDCWVIAHAIPGDGQHRAAMGSSEIPVQDRVNTFSNIEAETYEYGIPITYRDRKTFDEEANEDQRSEPGAEVVVIVPDGQDIRTKIMQVRADSVSPDMYKHNMDLIGPVSDQITGVFPALQGNPETGTDTLGGIAIQRDQAMGRMGIPYASIKQANADIMTLACRDFCKHTDGPVSMPILGKSGDFEAQTIDVTALEGEAEAYPEGDEAFPDQWNQQRSTFMQIMDSPQGQALIAEPDNAELATKLIGIPNLVIPGADARKKALKDVGILTKVPDGADVSEPAQIALVEIDPLIDDLPNEAATIKRYLISDAGQRLKRENPVGYMNVRTHLQQMIAQIQAQSQQPPPPPPKESVTANLKDMPPEAQAQWLEKELGIKIGPQDFLMKALLDKAGKHPPKPPVPGAVNPAQGAPNA